MPSPPAPSIRRFTTRLNSLVCYNNRVSALASEVRLGSILIIDDDESVVHSFARILTLEGYKVITAMNGSSGLKEAEAVRPDAIILDLRMPIVGGLVFLRRLRANALQRETPVAIVTGDFFLDDRVSAELQNLGAALKFKPLWLEDLVGLARTLLLHKVSR